METGIRIWVDGCFDCFHYGHSNALRQAKLMGEGKVELVVGVHSDKVSFELTRQNILENKGPTVLNEQERYAAVSACKWVDQIVEAAPYLTAVEYLDEYNCDFCVHGNDTTTMSDGSDCYALVKQAGRYKECIRTEGISTTDLVNRMLKRKVDPKGQRAVSNQEYVGEMMKLFKTDLVLPLPSQKVIYVNGSFDMFHSGHALFLKAAKSLGDYLIVGVLDDERVCEIEGMYPILDASERTLSCLACRYADQVIMECPSITQILREHKIDLVVNTYMNLEESIKYNCREIEYRFLDGHNLESEVIIKRILDDYELYEERQRKKMEKESLQ